MRTVPELVFEASDGEPLHVVVEAKPGYGMHMTEQLVHEVVDPAREEPSRRLALIAMGPILACQRQHSINGGRPSTRAFANMTVATVHYSSCQRG